MSVTDSWILEGQRVRGMYLEEFPVEGVVVASRVTFGSGVKHTIALDTPIEVYGSVRETVNLYHWETISG
jgi:hypothetical protein